MPAAAGAETVHVKGFPEQFGLLVVRLLAMLVGVPVYAEPLTVISVMTTDCVDGETYARRSCDEDVALRVGTVIVNCACVEDAGATEPPPDEPPAGEPPTGAPPVAIDEPAPEHPEIAKAAKIATTRVRTIIESVLLAS